MPSLAAALLILLLLVVPSSASAQAGVSYQVPVDNPFVGVSGAAPEVYALGLRNPFRFSFDRDTGDLLIGDVGQGKQEEVDWIGAAAARGANFGWACREGELDGPKASQCPSAGFVEPLFVYAHSSDPPVPDAITGGFVVRDPDLTGLFGRYLYADFYVGEIHSLALDHADPDNQSTGLALPQLASFGEDASGHLYAASLGGEVIRLIPEGTPGMLHGQQLGGTFSNPIAIGTVPGDPAQLFVAERGGTVRLVVGDTALPVPFLDLTPLVASNEGERGLLSVVAAPDYPSSGKFYVYYTDLGGDIRVDEFTRSAADPELADPASRRNVLTIEHSQISNHNGGQLHFGADGCLWITTGDGGGSNDQFNNSQNVGTLLGKILRINPNPPGVGGAACPGLPPASPPPGAGNAPPDMTGPALTARAPRRQRVLRLGGAVVRVRCDESCTMSAGGMLLARHRRIALRRARVTLTADQRSRLLVRLGPRARRLLRAALRRGGHPRVVLRLRATDGTGNRSAAVRRGVRVRR